MILLRSPVLRRPRRRDRSGSVIVLVVAVLALLAVIGTVYIVSARAQRSTAAATSVALNLDLAQNAVNQRVLDRIGADMYDATGTIGGYYNTTSMSLDGLPAFGTMMARAWDMPEIGVVNLPTLGASNTNVAMRDESWLASGIYRPLNLVLPAGQTANIRYNDLSLLTLGGFNPSKGTYDATNLNYLTLGPSGGLDPNPNLGAFNVVYPELSSLNFQIPNSPNVPQVAGKDAVINLLPFSEASGIRYRFGFRVVDTSSMANLNVGMPYDPATASAPANFPYFELYGTLLGGYNLTASSLASSIWGTPYPTSDAVALQAARNGSGSTTLTWTEAAMRADTRIPRPTIPFGLGDELELRAYGSVGSNIAPGPALASTNWGKALLGSRMGAATGLGVTGVSRGLYTTYSQSRDLRLMPENDLWPSGVKPYTLSAAPDYPGGIVWPQYPARVSASPNLDGRSPIAVAEVLASAATNIATAMEIVPGASGLPPVQAYSHQEACAFAANYITYFSNTWTAESVPSLTGGSPLLAYYLSRGPSFVDQQGICTRVFADGQTYDRNFGLATGPSTDLRSDGAGIVYLGYAAQPFLNEAVLEYHLDAATGAPSYDDSAIELYNPYNVALSLDDYQLRIDNTETIDFAKKGYYVPARGYFVITQTAGNLAPKITNPDCPKVVDPAGMLQLHGASNIYLMRRYVDRTGNAAYGAVDQYNVQAIGTFNPTPAGGPPFDSTPHPVSLARDNWDDTTLPLPTELTYPNRWVATVVTSKSVSNLLSDAAVTLGGQNANTNDITVGNGFEILHDANIDAIDGVVILSKPGPVIQVHGVTLNNVADFNRIMRMGDEINAANGLPVTGGVAMGTVPERLGAIYTNSADLPVANSSFKLDAMVHFDFNPPAGMYSFPGIPVDTNTPVLGDGDQRAVRLLDCLTFVDRYSDPNIIVNDPTGTGLTKLRIPGRININTASPEVLASLPMFELTGPTGVTTHPELVAAILAYRWRTVASPTVGKNDPRIPQTLSNLLGGDVSFKDVPGYGFRSISELLTVINYALSLEGPVKYPSPTNLDERDQIWADVYNYLTVRSDTFALYGYLEAVKQNPRYQGAFDNSTVWYGNNPGVNITDDPSDQNITSIPLLRVARRRWVAIIDRSQMNFNINDPRLPYFSTPAFPLPPTKPRIVAQRDLPQ